MRPTDMAFFDTETTGLDPLRHEVIGIHVIRCRPTGQSVSRPDRGGCWRSAWHTDGSPVPLPLGPELAIIEEAGGLVVPDHLETAQPKALEVNGFNPAQWAAEARPWPEVWRECRKLLEGANIVGHNVSFDIRFVDQMNARAGLPTMDWYHALDTASLAWPMVPRVVQSVSLEKLCDALGVRVEAPAHTARGDVIRTMEIYRRLVGGLRWAA